jgi:hypothetical protein
VDLRTNSDCVAVEEEEEEEEEEKKKKKKTDTDRFFSTYFCFPLSLSFRNAP